jgi:hypothetical protein
MIDKPIIPRERLPNSQIHQPNSHISQPTMDDNMPLSFYENIDRKNWTVEIIQRGLHISNDTYASICTVMEKEMRSHEVLGLLLKQPVVKKKLQPIFTYIIQRFPAIFENIPCAWREKCLTAIAQKCNYNMRRRRVRSVSPVHITDVEAQGRLGSPALMSDAVDPRPSKCLRSLDTITVHTIMVAGGKYSICRLLDLARKEPIDPLTIESLAYEQFIAVLREDIQFDTVKHTISYRYAKDIVVPISNERSWKAAIVDMHMQGMERLMFHIEEHGKWPNNRRHLYITNLSKVKLRVH